MSDLFTKAGRETTTLSQQTLDFRLPLEDHDVYAATLHSDRDNQAKQRMLRAIKSLELDLDRTNEVEHINFAENFRQALFISFTSHQADYSASSFSTSGYFARNMSAAMGVIKESIPLQFITHYDEALESAVADVVRQALEREFIWGQLVNPLVENLVEFTKVMNCLSSPAVPLLAEALGRVLEQFPDERLEITNDPERSNDSNPHNWARIVGEIALEVGENFILNFNRARARSDAFSSKQISLFPELERREQYLLQILTSCDIADSVNLFAGMLGQTDIPLSNYLKRQFDDIQSKRKQVERSVKFRTSGMVS